MKMACDFFHVARLVASLALPFNEKPWSNEVRTRVGGGEGCGGR